MSFADRHSRSFSWAAAMVYCCLIGLGGCAPMVMLGKMLQGDPLVTEDFKTWNGGKSLAKSGKKVAILCTTPESIKTEYAALDVDLLSEVSRKLAKHEISVVKPYKVATWIDDHGIENLDLKQLGTDIDADYVIQIKLDEFDYREENSPNLFRGRANGLVAVYSLVRATPSKGKDTTESGFLKGDKAASKKKETDQDEDSDKADSKSSKKSKSKKKESEEKDKKKDEKDEEKRDPVTSTRQLYNRTFRNIYPEHQPVSIDQMQPETFKKKFLDRVADDLAKLFYAHKSGTNF